MTKTVTPRAFCLPPKESQWTIENPAHDVATDSLWVEKAIQARSFLWGTLAGLSARKNTQKILALSKVCQRLSYPLCDDERELWRTAPLGSGPCRDEHKRSRDN
jgi:hypothetical protein